jgi:hypothetical protein
MPSLPLARASLPAGEMERGGRRPRVSWESGTGGRHRARVSWESGRETVREAPGEGRYAYEHYARSRWSEFARARSSTAAEAPPFMFRQLRKASVGPQLLVAIFLTAAATSFGSDFWPVEYSFEETYVGEASVSRGPHRVPNFDESDTLLRLVLTPRVKLGVLRLGFEYEQFSFGFGKNAPLPNTLQSVAAVVGIDTQFSDSILVRLETTPGVYSEAFRPGSNVFNMPFEIGGTYIYNPDLQFVLGVSIDVERKYPVIPGGGIRWKFQPKWVLNAVLPTPRLEYEWNKNLTLYAGANVKETNFRVSDDFGRDHGIPRLNHAVLTYSEVRAGAGFDWKVTSWLSVNAEAGYQPYRNFDFYRANIRFHEDGSAPYGMIALHGAF